MKLRSRQWELVVKFKAKALFLLPEKSLESDFRIFGFLGLG